MIALRGEITISVGVITTIAFVADLLSGFLGVGGGFIKRPAMVYGIGVPVPIAVGTDLFEIAIAGAIGSYLYAQEGGIDLGIVAPLLLGGALGVQIGSAATNIVEADRIKLYFGGMLLAGGVAVAIGEIGSYLGLELIELVSLVLLFGAATTVSTTIGYVTIRARRVSDRETST